MYTTPLLFLHTPLLRKCWLPPDKLTDPGQTLSIAVRTPQSDWRGSTKVADFDGILGCGTLKDELSSAHFKGCWETDWALQSCGVPERLKKRKQGINCLTTGLLNPCEQHVFISIPVARRCSLHTEKPEVSMSASQPGTLLMFVLTATAQPVHLHPIQKKGEAEWETTVPLWDKLKGLCNHKKGKGSKKVVMLYCQPVAIVVSPLHHHQSTQPSEVRYFASRLY